MTFVHTFYSEPLFQNKFEKFETSLNNIIWNYTYSLICVHKHNHKIKLYTDQRGKELLSFLPYDEIIVIDNFKTTRHFAASFKFYALKACELGDILIDGDLFLENKKVFNVIKLSKHDVLNSFIEKNDYIFRTSGDTTYEKQKRYFETLFSKMNTKKEFLKYDLPTLENLEYLNTSLLRINNQELKDEYVEQYFYHMNLLYDIDFEGTWPDLIIEQYFLGKIIEECDYTNKQIIVNFPNGSDWENTLGFIHLGSSKTRYLGKVKENLYALDKNLFMKANMKVMETLAKYNNNLI